MPTSLSLCLSSSLTLLPLLLQLSQVWEDVRKEQTIIKSDKYGPLGTTDKVEFDEDLPAQGKHYCVPCSKYFVSEVALLSHQKEKPHKKRVKELLGARPHNQGDADWAAGMGAPDNGKGPVTRAMDTQ
jgi:bud site selection protein 20